MIFLFLLKERLKKRETRGASFFCKLRAYLSLFVHWHIHSDEFLVCLSFWTLFAKSQGRVDRPKHVKHFSVMDLATEKESNIDITFLRFLFNNFVGKKSFLTYLPPGSYSDHVVINSPKW